MRVVAFGYMTWGRRTIEAVLGAGHEIPLIVTHPDSDNAYEKIFNESVAELAADRSIPLLVRNRADDAELREAIADAAADIMVVELAHLAAAGGLLEPAAGHPQCPRRPVARLRRLRPAELGADQRRVRGRRHRAHDERRVRRGCRRAAALDAGRRRRRDHRPVRPDAGHVRPDHGRRAGAHRCRRRFGRAHRLGPQDRRAASHFHRRTEEENRIGFSWPARDLFNLVRAQLDPYPNAYCFHGDTRLRIVAASVTDTPYGGTPGRIFIRRGTGVVIVAGADARHGRNPGLLVGRVRLDDDRELDAVEYFPHMGGYLTSHPAG